MVVFYSEVVRVSSGGGEIFGLFEIFPQEPPMLIPTSEVEVTAEDLNTVEIVPVLVHRTENVRFTEMLVLDAHDCGHHEGFGVVPVT
tara:strand:+ start:57 stop:317 length:261 start_codon:yes stop_codon:yes gene_type:complete